VSKSAGQTYNLTCQAGPTYPRPSLALYRYRAGQLEAGGRQQQQQLRTPVQDLQSGRRNVQRPRLAATALKQEPIAGTQVQLKINARRQQTGTGSAGGGGGQLAGPDSNGPDEMITMANSLPDDRLTRIQLDLEEDSARRGATADGQAGDEQQKTSPASPYEISAWALIDEASLSSNLVTQFECVLTFEGVNYEQRQSLALQKGKSERLISRAGRREGKIAINYRRAAAEWPWRAIKILAHQQV
jgi:hypothetical protein